MISPSKLCWFCLVLKGPLFALNIFRTLCFQDSNPFLKENLQRTEDLAFWLKQKTDDLVTVTNLKGPLKKLDSAAAQSLDNLDKARLQVESL